MEAHDEPTASGEARAGPDVAGVRRVHERLAAEGMLAGIEALLSISHEDVELRSYAAQVIGDGESELLQGHDEILAFFRKCAEDGFEINTRTRGYDFDGDTASVNASVRVRRPDGSFAETSLRWRYHFRDGLVDEVSWEPRAGS